MSEPFFKILATDRVFTNSPDAGDPDCLCSRCGLVIEDCCGPVRAWPEDGSKEYRYHAHCLGAGPCCKYDFDDILLENNW